MPDLTSQAASPQDPKHLSEKELLKRYRGRIELAKRWREGEGFDDCWKRLRDVYRLKMFPSSLANEDRIAIGVAFATVNVIAPSVAVNHPKIVVWAQQEGEADQATITEACINYWWRHYDIKPEFRSSVKDFLVYGHGWLKVGYRYVEGHAALEPEEQQLQIEMLSQQADDYAAENPELAGDLPSDEEIAEQIPDTEPVVLEDRPYVQRISPFDILVDPEATCPADMTWMAQKIIRPLEEVKRDTRYPAGARRKLKADGSVKWHAEESRHAVEDDAGRITLWEFYDLIRNTVSVFTEQGDRFLVEPDEMPYTYGIPFVMLRNYEVPDQFYPIGELEAIEPLQNELNATRSQMMQHRRAYARKWLYRSDAFGPEGVGALRSDKDNVMVPVENNYDLRDVIAAMPINSLDANLYGYSDVIETDIDRVSGVNEYMRGGLPEIRRTATEASIIQDAANARAADKLDQVEECIKQVARRLVQLVQQYMTGEQVVRVVGPAQATMWVPYTREDIEGEFDFDVEAGSTQPMNETFRRQQAVELMNTVAPMVGAVIDPAQLALHVLREGFGIKNPERFIMMQPPMPGDEGLPPGEQAAAEGQAPDGTPMPGDELGGTDAVDPAQLNQLTGQVGYQPQTMGV